MTGRIRREESEQQARPVAHQPRVAIRDQNGRSGTLNGVNVTPGAKILPFSAAMVHAAKTGGEMVRVERPKRTPQSTPSS